ncbi:hypothetical protein Rmet_6746 (plasmid) [Cupriavidus metallidurans CH34]|uniref:Uncharacterized protein n=1 Tax=Cupriavidus metallidurans (strain ATCC 43123 / DSM 2839 / NBRC 102507 / CH34) TaxID=266264 RepID=D3DYF5_CUPMC|nr:hypothetical protein Rmet_6746 [Cupriavidus metallidurans CH34]
MRQKDNILCPSTFCKQFYDPFLY